MYVIIVPQQNTKLGCMAVRPVTVVWVYPNNHYGAFNPGFVAVAVFLGSPGDHVRVSHGPCDLQLGLYKYVQIISPNAPYFYVKLLYKIFFVCNSVLHTQRLLLANSLESQGVNTTTNTS